jgi:hypothetical protein
MGDGLESVGLVLGVGKLTRVVDRFEIQIESFLSHLLRVKLAHLEQRVSPFYDGFLVDCKASCMFASKWWIPSCSITPAEDAATWFVNFGQPIPWQFLLPLLPLLFRRLGMYAQSPSFLICPTCQLAGMFHVSPSPEISFCFLQLKMHSSRRLYIAAVLYTLYKIKDEYGLLTVRNVG